MTRAVSQSGLPESTRRLLGVTVLLTQLPLLLHLPLWICLPGTLLVLWRIIPSLHNRLTLPTLIMTPLVLVGAFAIVMHYGHIFNRDPCVAFLFLLVGFKYLESNSRHDASLLVVLSAFLLMTQFFYWQSIAAAISSIPAIFFIGLSLFTLQRGYAITDIRFMVNITAKLLLQAIPIAMLLFVAVPRVTSPGWGEGTSGNGGATTGLSSRMSPGSISELSKSDAVAFRVEFQGRTPTPYDLYWRGPVLSGFDGRDWFILPRAKHNTFTQTQSSNATPASRLNYTVTLEPTHNPWLPALDAPASLPVRITRNNTRETIAAITEEKQLDSLIKLTRPVRYSTESVITDRFFANAIPGAEYLLTTERNPKARRLATEMRSTYPEDAVLANQILRMFNQENFSYTLSPPKLQGDAIDDFLFNSRSGFCEHYSGSFVFMMRAAGIPARVVTGYQGGEINDNYMIVRQSDAHAWAEVFIDEQWQRFDPTAAVAPERIEQGIGEVLRSEGRNAIAQLPLVKALQLKWDKVNYTWQSMVIGFDSDSQSEMWQKLGLQKPGALTLVLLIMAAVLVWIALILAPWSLLRRDRSDLCQLQWEKLCRSFESRGIARHNGETAEAYVVRLTEHWPIHKNTLGQLLAAYHAGRFGKDSEDAAAQKRYAGLMRDARKQLNQF